MALKIFDIELIEKGDSFNKGIGFFTLHTDAWARSLLSIFWKVEKQQIQIEVLFLRNLEILIPITLYLLWKCS